MLVSGIDNHRVRLRALGKFLVESVVLVLDKLHQLPVVLALGKVGVFHKHGAIDECDYLNICMLPTARSMANHM
jgi:hypothetical protein